MPEFIASIKGVAGGALYYVLVVVIAVIAGGIVIRLASRAIRKFFGDSSVADASIVINLVRVLVFLLLAYFVGENVFDLELGGIFQALGVTTLVVSLGLQDLIKNVVAGVQIVMTHLLKVGDHISVGGIRGEVTDVNWRQTVVRDKDNNPNIIPNAALMSGQFTRLDGKMARRYLLDVEVKTGLDLNVVADDIAGLADEVLLQNGWKADEPSEVRFLGSTANGIQTSIRLFLTDVAYTAPAYDAVMRAIGQRGYLSDWTNDIPAQDRWR